MWIVTQDRDEIINTEKITRIYIINSGTSCDLCADNECLGKYKTEEEAISELARIAQAKYDGREIYDITIGE